ARLPGFVAAVVYGSVARGEATPWSDVDIALLCSAATSCQSRRVRISPLKALKQIPSTPSSGPSLPSQRKSQENRDLLLGLRGCWGG
ncbi:MAG: nucleotidyltransferase domain-containing protein, partial [Actinobacteria bacterium]|nr:nucleotidyltransferase domain-containing protein [Actinomycetota bacterium]